MEINFKKNYNFCNLKSKTDYSEVYKAVEINTLRTVCIKVIDLSVAPDKFSGQKLLEAVKKEVQALVTAGDNISNVPCIFDSYHDKAQNKYYIIMQWIDGSSLREYMACSAYEFLGYIIKLAKILNELHELRIYHKDIKPENIIIKNRDVRLIDFNISFSLPNIIEGTPPYSAPEMYLSTGEVGREHSDVFALGVILYEYFTGEAPCNGIHFAEDVMNPNSARWGYFKPAKELALEKAKPPISNDLDAIITKCLNKSPRDRYTNLKFLVKDLIKVRGNYAK